MLQFLMQLNDDEKQSLLNMVNTFLKNRPSNHHDDNFQPVTAEQYNLELEEADAEIEAGHYLSHEDVKKRLIQ